MKWLIKRGICFDADGGNSGGGGDPAGTGDGAGAGGGDKGSDTTAKTFTQAQLDEMFTERVERASRSAISNLLKKLGLESVEALSTLVTTAKEQREAELSETQKLQAKVAELEKLAETQKRERQETMTRFMVEAAAGKLGVVDTEAAFKLLEPEALTYNEAGEPTNVEQVVKDLIARKPFLAAAGSTSAANPPSGRATALTLDEIKRMSPDEINRRWDEVQVILNNQGV